MPAPVWLRPRIQRDPVNIVVVLPGHVRTARNQAVFAPLPFSVQFLFRYCARVGTLQQLADGLPDNHRCQLNRGGLRAGVTWRCDEDAVNSRPRRLRSDPDYFVVVEWWSEIEEGVTPYHDLLGKWDTHLLQPGKQSRRQQQARYDRPFVVSGLILITSLVYHSSRIHLAVSAYRMLTPPPQ